MQRKKFFSRFVFPWIASLFLLATTAQAQTKFSIFDQVGARGAGLTPAKGQLFYTSDTNGTIIPLAIGNTNDCLLVSGSGTPVWSGSCVGFLSSVGLSMPGQFSLSNNPLTSNGTITISWQNAAQNYFLAGPTSGTGAPTFRSITNGDLGNTSVFDVFGASGVNHKKGLVPDPGASEGSTRFLREDATWVAPSGTGTVTSVGLSMPSQFGVTNSPVTDAGTLTVAWNTQTANYALLGPASGAAAVPTFRAFDARDFGLTTKGDLLTRGTANTPARLGVGTDGYVLMADANETTGLRWAAVSGVGTVTSVDATVPSGFSVSGVPITGAGTIAISYASASAHHFLGSTAGGTPSFQVLDPTDYPAMTATVRGSVPTPPNDSSQVLKGNGTWGTLPGTGTVTSVGLSMPSWYTVTNSPVTDSGTLTVTAASGQTANRFLATPNGSAGAISLRAVASADLPLNTTSQAGAVSQAPNDSAKFWRGDASWAVPPANVTSVDVSVPGEMSIANNPITSSGTLAFGWNAEVANRVFAGPESGDSTTPTFRALVAADLPVFVGSGTNHAKGAVPDPGATPGTTKYLREDAQWVTPTFNSSIEVKEVDGSPDATGVSVLRFDQATGLTVTDNGSGTATVACTGCGGGTATATRQDSYVGDGETTLFVLGAAPATDGIIFVSLNGLPQPTSAWSVEGSNLTMDTAPITGALLEVGYYTALPGTVTHAQEDFVGDGNTTDFTFTHPPVTNGVLLVSLRGLVQTTAGWTIVGGGTQIRISPAPKSGDVISVSYNY
jgi:hypothetical protein